MKVVRLDVGERVTFAEEKQCYTVQAAGYGYAILTKPINCQDTVIYTIVDLHNGYRGTDDLVFGKHDYSQKDHCENALSDLINANMRISRRNRIDLNITDIRRPKRKE